MATNLSAQIGLFATRVGAECKAIYTLIGYLSELTTSDTSSIVKAINEVKSATTSNSSAVGDLQGRMTSVEGRMSTAEGKITTNEGNISTIQGDIEELSEALEALEGVVAGQTNIDDNNVSAATTYSSSKIENLVTTAKQTVKDELLGGAGTAYDTLQELAALIETNKDAIEALEGLAAGHVRYDAAQELTDEQKTQARTNIGAAPNSELQSLTNRVTTAEGTLSGVVTESGQNKTAITNLTTAVGNTEADFVSVFEAALV